MPSTVNPAIQNISWDRSGSVPNVTTLNLYINEGSIIEFVNYNIQFENTTIEWIYAVGTSGAYIEHNGVFATIPLALQNLDDLLAGSYKANILL